VSAGKADRAKHRSGENTKGSADHDG